MQKNKSKAIHVNPCPSAVKKPFQILTK